MTTLNQDYKHFIQLLNTHRIRYLIVGGYALAQYGQPGDTGDLDVWVEMDEGNARRVVAAIEDYGLGSAAITGARFLKPQQLVQIGHPPSRIDLLTSISGVDFPDCYDARQQVDIDGVPVTFISRDYLKKNKAATGRPQDQIDLEKL